MSVQFKDRKRTDAVHDRHGVNVCYYWKPPSACAECTAAVSESGEEADTGVETAEAGQHWWQEEQEGQECWTEGGA
jgi:hypothetical protein